MSKFLPALMILMPTWLSAVSLSAMLLPPASFAGDATSAGYGNLVRRVAPSVVTVIVEE
jgi:hypothetical protein